MRAYSGDDLESAYYLGRYDGKNKKSADLGRWAYETACAVNKVAPCWHALTVERQDTWTTEAERLRRRAEEG